MQKPIRIWLALLDDLLLGYSGYYVYSQQLIHLWESIYGGFGVGKQFLQDQQDLTTSTKSTIWLNISTYRIYEVNTQHQQDRKVA